MKIRCVGALGLVLGTCVSGVQAQPPAAVGPAVPAGSAATLMTPSAYISEGAVWGETGTAASRVYGRGEYLLWWIRDSHLPALVTTGDSADLIPGAIGNPSTRVVLGNESVNHEEFSGGRFMVGYWLDSEGTVGIEGSYFFLGERGVGRTVGSAGAGVSPVLSRPFFNVTQGIQDVDPVAFPFVQGGTVNVGLTSELWGAEASLRYNLAGNSTSGFGLLGGFRFLELKERLRIDAITSDLLPGTGNDIAVFDQFGTRNRFYGGQIGAVANLLFGNFVVDVRGKVALGATTEQLNISGGRSITDTTGTTTTFAAGLLAQPTNSGKFNHSEFAVIPEVNVNLGYKVTDNLRVFTGYSFLYWSQVARPADQIDFQVNTTQFPPNVLTGPARPQAIFHSTDFWAQGISFGAEFRY